MNKWLVIGIIVLLVAAIGIYSMSKSHSASSDSSSSTNSVKSTQQPTQVVQPSAANQAPADLTSKGLNSLSTDDLSSSTSLADEPPVSSSTDTLPST